MNNRIEATYKTHLDESLNNSPLTEAIEVITSAREVIEILRRQATIQNNYWDLPSVYKKTQQRQLTIVHEPHPWAPVLYEDVVSQMLFGLIKRHPFDPDTVKMQMDLARIARLKKKEDINNELFKTEHFWQTTAPCSVGHGLSGSGKTTTIRNVLMLIPQVIQHHKYQGKLFRQDQLTWISFDLPPSHSPKALALNFFRAIDDALGTNYFDIWSKRSKDSIEHHYAAMQLVAAVHYLGFIHIDEVQFMTNYPKSKESPSLPIIESLFNKIGVPTLLTCTPEGMELFETIPDPEDDHQLPNFTLTRRVFSEESYKFTVCNYQSEFFNNLFNELFPKGLSLNGHPPTESFKKDFYKLSAGLPAIIVRLARLYHKTAATLEKTKEQLDPTVLLHSVFDTKFSMLKETLELLRQGKEEAFENKLSKSCRGKTAWTNDEIKSQEQQQRKPKKSIPDISKAHLPPKTISDEELHDDFQDFLEQENGNA